MSFGISAATWAMVGAATVAAGTVYNADQQRKSIHKQQDALKLRQKQDALEKAQAEVSAQDSANASVMASRKRRSASALALGDPTADTLGGTSALGAGSATPVVSARPGTALGAGGQ